MNLNENELRNLEARRKQLQRDAKNHQLVREATREQREARKSELQRSANALSRFVSLFL